MSEITEPYIVGCLNCGKDYDAVSQGSICPHEIGGRNSITPWEDADKIQQVENMTDAELDAELRKNGLDPDQVVNNMISKLVELVKAKNVIMAEAETVFNTVVAERDSLKARVEAMGWQRITEGNLPNMGDEILTLSNNIEFPNDCDVNMYAQGYGRAGWVYRRPINPPQGEGR